MNKPCSIQRYEDNGIYVTEMVEESAASRSGLRVHDKILQLNGYDFTMVNVIVIIIAIFIIKIIIVVVITLKIPNS